MVTEFNYMGSLSANVVTPANALFVADSYASWLDQGVRSIQYLEMSANNFVGDTSSLTRGSAFYAIQMLNYMADPGDAAVNATSSSSNVRVHAVVQEDGTVAVMILNLNASTTDVHVSINGLQLATSGTRYSTTGAGITSANVSGLGNAFTITGMPARTDYLFLIPRRLAGDFNEDGIVDAGDYAIWRHMLGQSVVIGSGADADGNGQIDQADFDIWRSNFGNSSPGQGSAQLDTNVPEPTAQILFAVGALGVLRRKVSHSF
jgi:hypothetical protein